MTAPEPIILSVGVEGMTCASCVNRIERFLRQTDGVAEASVNLATERATIRVDPSVAGRAEVVGTSEYAVGVRAHRAKYGSHFGRMWPFRWPLRLIGKARVWLVVVPTPDVPLPEIPAPVPRG